MSQFTVKDTLRISAKANNYKSGDKLKVLITLLDKDKKDLAFKKDTITVGSTPNVSYKFKAEDIAKSFQIDPDDVIYAKGWIDNNGDGKIGYNEEVFIDFIEEEVLITVIVELPHSSSTGVGAWGLAGHTGIAIGDRYFDYGPELDDTVLKDIDEPKYGADFNGDGDSLDSNLDLSQRRANINQNVAIDFINNVSSLPKDISEIGTYVNNIRNDIGEANNILTGEEDINAIFTPGRPWWANNIAVNNNISLNKVNLRSVLNFISIENDINGNVYTIEFFVSKTNADNMIKWWEEKYKKLGVYSIRPYSGEQCTTTVISSLEAGGIDDIDFITLTPQGILEDLKTEVKSTSIQHKDEKAKVTLIKKEQ